MRQERCTRDHQQRLHHVLCDAISRVRGTSAKSLRSPEFGNAVAEAAQIPDVGFHLRSDLLGKQPWNPQLTCLALQPKAKRRARTKTSIASLGAIQRRLAMR